MSEREFRSGNQDFSNKALTAVGTEILRRSSGELDPAHLDNVFRQGRWSKIAEALRKYPREAQEQAALDFFGPRGGNFPNGPELARFIVELNNIPWFSPKGPPDPNQLQQNLDQFSTDINLSQHPIHVIFGDWEQMHIRGINEMVDGMIDSMKVPVFSALQEHGRWQAAGVAMDAAEGCVNAAIHTGWEKTRDISGKAWGAARSAAANASILAKYAASSIVVHGVDDPFLKSRAGFQKANPIEGLFNIYKMGAVPVGAQFGGSFVVFWPMK